MHALRRGPLYIGALPLVTDLAPAQVEAGVRELARQGKVTRDIHGTVTLTVQGASTLWPGPVW